MNEQKLKTVQQWRTALQEAARTAVEALAFETPINKAVPSLAEQSDILGLAINKIRKLVRPEPKTVAFMDEARGEAVRRIPPADEPIDPKAPKLVRGEDHMAYPEASAILMELARKRSMSIDQVNALEIAVRRLMCRHFQRQRNWAKRRAARSVCGDSVAAPHPEPLSPEEELADTIKRPKEDA